MERYTYTTGPCIGSRTILSAGVLLTLVFFRYRHGAMHRLQMRTGSGDGSMGRWMPGVAVAVLALVAILRQCGKEVLAYWYASVMKRGIGHKIITGSMIALIILLVFAGVAVADVKGIPRSGDGVSSDLYETQDDLLTQEQTGCCVDPQMLNSSEGHSLNYEIDSSLLNKIPVFVFFYAEWCHFCQPQKTIIEEVEQEYADKIVFIHVNAEENPHAINEFGVTGFPAMFLIVDKNEEGYVYQEFDGYTEKETLKESFEYMVVSKSVFYTENVSDNVEKLGKTESLDNGLDYMSHQEVGDAVYQDLPLIVIFPLLVILPLGLIDEHAAIYGGYLGGDPDDRANHWVIEEGPELDWWPGGMRNFTMKGFEKGYRGAYTGNNGTLDKTIRNNIIKTADDLFRRDIRYVSPSEFIDVNLIPDWSDNYWDGSVEDIKALRCDGVVEYCYEKNGVVVWSGHISDPTRRNKTPDAFYNCVGRGEPVEECKRHIPPGYQLCNNDDRYVFEDCDYRDHRSFNTFPFKWLTPRTQRTNSALSPSKPEPPTKVDIITSDINNYGIVTIEWNQATDEQSGLWGYYYVWDNAPKTIPLSNWHVWYNHKLEPDMTSWTSSNSYTPEAMLRKGKEYWFHIRSVDNAGNMAGTTHRGPFLIPCTEDSECDKCEECILWSGLCVRMVDCPPGPGGDHPDETHAVSTSMTTSNPSNPIATPKIAILSSGFAASTSSLLESLNEPSTFVDIDFSPDIVKDHPILIIPSGGLYGLDSLPTFKSQLKQYVEDGGTVIVFAQQHGYEYNTLPLPPGSDLSGYGWLEDQSCQHRSVGITTYHPILSGQDSVISDINVDGYFTKYPKNATIILSRTKNGMPAMLMYEYGNGTVIATTAYTDWASTHYQATRDGKNLIRDMITWAKDGIKISEYGRSDTVNIKINRTIPKPEILEYIEYPKYELDDVVNIPINVTNYFNVTIDNVSFIVYDPDMEIDYVNVSIAIHENETRTINFTYEDTDKEGFYYVLYSLCIGESCIRTGDLVSFFGVNITIPSLHRMNYTLLDPDKNIIINESILSDRNVSVANLPINLTILNFTYTNPSKLGIWNLEYDVLDSNNTFIDSGTEKFAVSKYAENPDGWVYQGSEIAFDITTPCEDVPRGNDVTFSIHIYNNGDVDKNIAVKKDWNHRIIGEETVFVPAHNMCTITYTMKASTGRFWAWFYDDDYCLGKASKGIRTFYSSIDIDMETDEQEYARGEDVSLLLNFTNKQSDVYNTTVIVRALDPDNNKIFEDKFNANLSAYESLAETLSFTLQTTSGMGTYVVTAEAYSNGDKMGSNSTYFEVLKEYIVKVDFDEPDKAYRIRENISIDLEVKNFYSTLWNSDVNISIPVLAFEDSKYMSPNIGESKKISYDLNIPATIPAGKHDVIVSIGFDNSVRQYYFVIPDSNIILTSDKTNCDTGEYLYFNLTNTGGVDTECNWSIKFYDPRALLFYENDTNRESLLTGEIKTFPFRIPDQAVSGRNYLIASWKDLNTGKISRLSKSYDISGLNASLTSNTDRRIYLKDENLSIITNITNLNGAIVNGTLNLKIVYPHIHNPTSKTSCSANYKHNDLVTHEPYQHPKPVNGSEDIPHHTILREQINPIFDREPPALNSNDKNNNPHALNPYTLLSSNISYVPDDYAKIQLAVNSASTGDTIIVRDGTYTENVDVNKLHLTIRSENGSTNCIVNAAGPDDHVFEVTADYVNINGFTVKGATKGYPHYSSGIYLDHADHCNLSDNRASNNYNGIVLSSSSNNTLTNNTANSNNYYGIHLSYSSNNTLTNNTANSNRYYGIHLDYSSNNTLTNDTMSGNRYNFDVYGESLSQYIQDIDTSNLVDGKPIYYGVNQQNQQVPNDAGYVGVVNSTNITVRDLVLTNNPDGVLFAYTDNSRIENVKASNTGYGIRLYYSSNNTLTHNTASNNWYGSIVLSYSSNNTLTNNTASDDDIGVYLYFSSNNTLTNNTANLNNNGIHLSYSSNNTLTNNTANSNNGYGIHIDYSSNNNNIENNTVNSNNNNGIYLDYSSNNNIENNTVNSNNGYGIYLSYSSNNNTIIKNTANSNDYHGICLDYSRNNTITNNIANYSNWCYGIHLSSSSNNTLTHNIASNNYYSGIRLDRSSNNTLTHNTASNNYYNGIYLWYSRNNTITNNTASNTEYGIRLDRSSNNSIKNNTVNSNDHGIYLQGSSTNIIYNNYFANTRNARDDGNNIWNITKTPGTNIVGGPWLGGNYWSDYEGVDEDGDGLGDTLIPHDCSGSIQNGGDYLPLIKPEPPIGNTIWETNITIDMDENEIKNIITDIPMDVLKDVTGKIELITTLYSNTTQIIYQHDPFFYITDTNTSLILETDKMVYKPDETIHVYGEVKNHGSQTESYNLSIKKDGDEIFADAFTLNPDETHDFATIVSSNTSFTLEGTVDGATVTDFVNVEAPSINVSVMAPDVVGLADFDVGVLIENTGKIYADINVSINSTWNITIPVGESILLETTMSTKKNITLNVTISGDVNRTIQKEIICGENARINITPQSNYLDGRVEIPYTIENIGIMDSKFNATFSIENQTVSESFLVPSGENITDIVLFNLTKGLYLLNYLSPFEDVNVTINVQSPPELVVTSIYPENMNFTIGQNVTMTFVVGNTGGSEGEATLTLSMPDFEDTNRTWVRPGEKENISFNLTIPDDLEEKNYKGIYEIDGKRADFTFFVQGANISVDASLDKHLYVEGETAILTLNVINERNTDLSLYSRVKFNEYDNVSYFNLTGLDSETLTFNVPVQFTGDNKMLYTVYMDSGRSLYINSIYVYEKMPDAPITLYTDKDVYNMGENVTIHIVDVTRTDLLNLTAPNFNYIGTISGPTTLDPFTLLELRSGTYYIEYTFGNFSSAHPFDVIGYSARVLEAGLDKEEHYDGDIIKLKMDIETNRDVSGSLKTWIYDPRNELIDEFEINKTLKEGENKIEISRTLSTNKSGMHVLVYGIYAYSDLIFLASGAEYFDVISQYTLPSSITNLHSTQGPTWINWTWTNPSDPDFNHTELYLNGTFLTNIPVLQNYYNITGLLPDISYELSTRTVDTSGNINLTWVNDTASTLPASGTTLNLYTGWNLISLPLMSDDTSSTSILSPVSGNYSIVWAYNASDTTDHWKKYDPTTPFGNDLTTMEPGNGYWIMMTSDDTLNISRTMPAPTDIELWSGWNLIGYNSLNPQTITDALSSIDGNYSIIWAYNASDSTDHWKKYDPNTPFGNDLANMEPGKGYWIMMTTDDILEI